MKVKKQKEEIIDFTTRMQKAKSDELQRFARRDKKSVSALLANAIDDYLAKRQREYFKPEQAEQSCNQPQIFAGNSDESNPCQWE